MAKRNYKLQDVYDYLIRYYGLEWRGYQIKDSSLKHNNNERGLRSWDFNTTKTYFSVVAIVYEGAKQKIISLSTSNENLVVYEVNPYLHHYKEPEVSWQDFLAQRYGQEQDLVK
jgi:hypothetical protein